MVSEGDILNKENDIITVRLSNGDTYTDFNEENKINHGVWINDLYFEVPPERISSQEENSYAEFQGMRSNNSFKIPTGIASEIYSISFTIPHKSAIKNIDYRGEEMGGNTGNRGGVLDLILQFKHIPFACIENAYFRSKLKVPSTHNMVFCMHNLALSTSPGEPNVLVGTLTISPVAYTPYSDRWLFKRQWQSKNGENFDTVNKINLPGRVPYAPLLLDFTQAEATAPAAPTTTGNSTANGAAPAYDPGDAFPEIAKGGADVAERLRKYQEWRRKKEAADKYQDETMLVNTKVINGTAAPTFSNSLVNPVYQTPESLNYMDMAMMAPFEVTQYAKESEPFKAYIDWIYYQYTNKIVDNTLEKNTFDFTQIQPYGAENFDLGNVIILKWKEFKNIAIDPEVGDKLRLYIKRRVASHRAELFKGKIDNLNSYGTAPGEINNVGTSGGTSTTGGGAPMSGGSSSGPMMSTGPTSAAEAVEEQLMSTEPTSSENMSTSANSGAEAPQSYVSVTPPPPPSSSIPTGGPKDLAESTPSGQVEPAESPPAGSTPPVAGDGNNIDFSKPFAIKYTNAKQLKYVRKDNLWDPSEDPDAIIFEPVDWELEKEDPGYSGYGETRHIQTALLQFARIAKKYGITNLSSMNEAIAGFTAISLKESRLSPRGEGGAGRDSKWKYATGKKDKQGNPEYKGEFRNLPGYTEEEYNARLKGRKNYLNYFDARYGIDYKGTREKWRTEIKNHGHTKRGDGYWYRGKGIIQITWKDNYQKRSKGLYGDPNVLGNNPWAILNKRISWYACCNYVRDLSPIWIKNYQNATMVDKDSCRRNIAAAGLTGYGDKNWQPKTSRDWMYIILCIVFGGNGNVTLSVSNDNYIKANQALPDVDFSKNGKYCSIIAEARAEDAVPNVPKELILGLPYSGPIASDLAAGGGTYPPTDTGTGDTAPAPEGDILTNYAGMNTAGQGGTGNEEQRQIAKTVHEAISSLPKGVTAAEDTAIKKYLAQIEKLKADGWHLFDRDLTTFDLFYKEHEMAIIGDGNRYSPHLKEPLICDFMSGTAFNLFKKMPMQGLITPTAQFLGRQDNTFIMSFRGNGLNSIKKLEVIKDTLKKQGIIYKYIPEAYSLRVENNFMNAFGDLYFVINGLENATLPEAPGSYSMEMRLTANDIYVKHTKIKKSGGGNRLQVIESFLNEILRLGKTHSTYSATYNEMASQTESSMNSAGGNTNSTGAPPADGGTSIPNVQGPDFVPTTPSGVSCLPEAEGMDEGVTNPTPDVNIGEITEEDLEVANTAVSILESTDTAIKYLMGDGSIKEITGGSLYNRIANPGIIRPSSFSEANGQLGVYEGTNVGKNSVFYSSMFGYRAMYNSIFGTKTYSEKSIQDFLNTYPSVKEGNELNTWIAETIASLGVPTETLLKNLTQPQKIILLDAIVDSNGLPLGDLVITAATPENIAIATPLYTVISNQWLGKPMFISSPPDNITEGPDGKKTTPSDTTPVPPANSAPTPTRRDPTQKLFLEVTQRNELIQKAVDEANKNKEFKLGGEYGFWAAASDAVGSNISQQTDKLGIGVGILPVAWASQFADNMLDSSLQNGGVDKTGIIKSRYPKDDTNVVSYRIADVYPALTAGHNEFLSELCGALNLCNKLIMPDDYLYATPGYKTKFPENKRLISIFRDGNVLFSALKKDEPYMFLRKHTFEDRPVRYPPQGNTPFNDFIAQAPMSLNNVAPPMWDWVLEDKPVEYDLTDGPIRMFAFTTMEGEENLTFQKAKNLWWSNNGYNLGEPFYPYLASHRSIIGIAENTWYLWYLRRFLNDDRMLTLEGGITGAIKFNYEDFFGADISWRKGLIPNDLFHLENRSTEWNIKIILAGLAGLAAVTVATGGLALFACAVVGLGYIVKDFATGRGNSDLNPFSYGVNWFYIKEDAVELAINRARKENEILEQNRVIEEKNKEIAKANRAAGAEIDVIEARGAGGAGLGGSSGVGYVPPIPPIPLPTEKENLPAPKGEQKPPSMNFILRPSLTLETAFMVGDLRGVLDGIPIDSAFTLQDFADLLKKNPEFTSKYKNLGDNVNSMNHTLMVLPDDTFMDYVWNYLIIPYLNNVLQYEKIVDIATGTDYFPRTRELIIQAEQSSIGPAYEDLMLPYHPYWNSNGRNLSRGPSFTEPDFYLVNPGVDIKLEEYSRKIDTKTSKLTPSEAYNFYVGSTLEYSYADMQGMQNLMVQQNPEIKIQGSDTAVADDKKVNAVQSDIMDKYVGPKAIFADPNVVPIEQQKYDPKSNLVNWADARLMFGDNLNLISPLNANFTNDGKLLNARMLNYSYQDYDVNKGEDALLKMRFGYNQEYLNSGTNTQGDPVSNPTGAYPLFDFHNMEDDGGGDASPIMNFSNTRYPMQQKLKEAIKSVGKRKMAGRRAYPNFKIYFIEEDDLYSKSFTDFDDFYTFSTIESLEISDSRKRPAAVAKITFLDQHGILSGFNQWTKAADPQIVKKNGTDQDFDSEYALGTESANPFLKGTKYEQSDIGFKLNPGLKIKICGGFSNDSNKLEELFLGEITDVNMDGSGNRVEVIAMSYGAELAAAIKGISEDETKVEFNDTFDLLAHLMFEPEVLHFGHKKFDSVEMFGESQSLKTNQIQYKETFAAGAMINAARPGGFPNYFALYKAGESVRGAISGGVRNVGGGILYDGYERMMKSFSEAAKKITIEPNEGPQDDNIFAPNFTPQQGYYWYDYFKRWTGSVTKDGDMRVVSATNSDKMDGVDIGAATAAVAVPVAAIGAGAIGGMAGSALAALGTLGAVGGATMGAMLFAIVSGIGIGILIGIAVGIAIAAVAGIVTTIIDGITNSIDAKEMDSAMLIQIHSPDSLKYNIFYSTIWDMFEEMTLRHPGYVKHPRIYYNSNRMTMFFGLPDQNMWERAGDPLDVFRANKIFKEMAADTEKRYQINNEVGPLKAGPKGRTDIENYRLEEANARDNETGSTSARRLKQVIDSKQKPPILVDGDRLTQYMKYVVKRFKPFRKWHNVNSYTDIISNDIDATADGWYTEVQVQYTDIPGLFSDTSALNASQNKKLDIRDPNSVVDWDADKVETKRATVNLAPNFVRSTSYQFVNAKSKGMAKCYARALLAKQAKDMYKGSLTIMGNPSIRPYDVCMLCDTYNNMYGPIEVEEVHHIFSPETGYVTQIYPDTFIVQEDVTPYVIMNGIQHDVFTRNEYYMENALAAAPAWGDVQNMSSEGRKYMEGLQRVITEYRRSTQENEREIKLAKDALIGDPFSNPITDGSLTQGASIAMAGGAVVTGIALGLPAAPVVLAGALAFSLTYFYAASTLSNVILNYIADSRAFMMIPLMREGIPMVAGINIGYGSGMYKGPLEYIRQYWMDGAIGGSMKEADLLMQHNNVYVRNGGNLDSWLATSQLDLQRFSLSFDNMFTDIRDNFTINKMFKAGNDEEYQKNLQNKKLLAAAQEQDAKDQVTATTQTTAQAPSNTPTP
jgi:hypothetical protein